LPCHWLDEDTRAVRHRHVAGCMSLESPSQTCAGCEPCNHPHCPLCGRRHAVRLCDECRGKVRTDLTEIARQHEHVSTALETDLAPGDHEGGLPLGGELMVMAGPVSMSATDDERQPPPAAVVVRWEYRLRLALGQPTDLAPTLARAIDYLTDHLHELPAEVDAAAMARDVHSARVRLEDVLHHGMRHEYGVQHVRCGGTLVRECDPHTGLADDWSCHRCHARLTEPEYRYAVGVAYMDNAPAMSAADLERKTGVAATVIRVWGARGNVRKQGKDRAGLQMYNVADVEARADISAIG
jgi:hypothetical protein